MSGDLHLSFSFDLPGDEPPVIEPTATARPGTRITHILVHTAVPVRAEEFGDWVEGEREEEVVEGIEFPCVIFPAGTREGGRSGRRLDQPMMMIDGMDKFGETLTLGAEDRIRVTAAPGLSERDVTEYQVDGEPLPLGRPGSDPQGYQVNLRRVLD